MFVVVPPEKTNGHFSFPVVMVTLEDIARLRQNDPTLVELE